MNDKSYLNWRIMSDKAIEKEMGLFIKKHRQQQKKTQAQLSKEAQISRSTLSLLERGETGTLKTYIQLLRVLDKLYALESFQYRQEYSPIALAKMQLGEPKRIRYKKP